MKISLQFTRPSDNDLDSTLDYVSRDGLIGLQRFDLPARRKASLKGWVVVGHDGKKWVTAREIRRKLKEQLTRRVSLPSIFASRHDAHEWLVKNVMDQWELWDYERQENAAAQPRIEPEEGESRGRLRYRTVSDDWGVTYRVPAHAPYYNVFTQKLEGEPDWQGGPVRVTHRKPADALKTPYVIMQLEALDGTSLQPYFDEQRKSWPKSTAWAWSYSTRAFGMPSGVDANGFYENQDQLGVALGSPGFAYIRPGKPPLLDGGDVKQAPVFAKKAEAIKSAEAWLQDQWPDGRELTPGEKNMLRSALERLHATQLGAERVRDDAGFNNADLQWSKGVVGIWDEVENDPARLAAVGAVLSSYRNTQLMPEEVRAADVAMALMQDGHAQAREELSGVLKERAKEERREKKEAERKARALAREAAKAEARAIKVYTIEPGTLVVKFPYDQEVLRMLKEAFPQRRYAEHMDKAWTVYNVDREQWADFIEGAENERNIIYPEASPKFVKASQKTQADRSALRVEFKKPTRRSSAYEIRFTTRHPMFTAVKDAVKATGARFRSVGDDKFWRATKTSMPRIVESLKDMPGVEIVGLDDRLNLVTGSLKQPEPEASLAPAPSSQRPEPVSDDGWGEPDVGMFAWLQEVPA